MVRTLRAAPLTVLTLCLGIGSLIGVGAHFVAQVAGSPLVIENTDSRFAVSNVWTEIRPQNAVNNEQVYAYWASQAGVPVKATWRMPVTPGTAHTFYITYTPFSTDKMDTGAKIRVLDGNTVLLTKTINQNVVPSEKQLLGRGWIVLGSATPMSGEVTIESTPSTQTVAAGAVLYHVADAVAVEKGSSTQTSNTSCLKIVCAQLPAGCTYDNTRATKDANGCVVDCGPTVCPQTSGGTMDIAVTVKDDRTSGRAFVFTIANLGTTTATNVNFAAQIPANSVTITMPQSSNPALVCATSGTQIVKCSATSIPGGQSYTVRLSYAPTSYCSQDQLTGAAFANTGIDANQQNNGATLVANPCVCGNGSCDYNETNSTCPSDCKSATTSPVCGNKKCETNENPYTCPADCSVTSVCGNGICETNENASCPNDCKVTATPPSSSCFYQPSCPAPNQGCEYDVTKISRDANGCPLDCGPQKCATATPQPAPSTGTVLCNISNIPWTVLIPSSTPLVYPPELQLGLGGGWLNIYDEMQKGVPLGKCGIGTFTDPLTKVSATRSYIDVPWKVNNAPTVIRTYCPYGTDCVSGFCRKFSEATMAQCGATRSWNSACTDDQGINFIYAPSTLTKGPDKSQNKCDIGGSLISYFCNNKIPDGKHGTEPSVGVYVSGGCPYQNGSWLTCVSDAAGTGYCAKAGSTPPPVPPTPPTLPPTAPPTTPPTAPPPMTPAPTAEYCGDGKVQTQYEQCDDGNFVNGDGCTSRCLKEAGYQTVTPPTTSTYNVPTGLILSPNSPSTAGTQDLMVKATLPQSMPQGSIVLTIDVSNIGTKTATDAKVVVSTGGLQETMIANTGNCTQVGAQIGCGPFVLDPGATRKFTVTLKPAQGTSCGMTIQESATVITAVAEANGNNNFSAAYSEYLCPGTTQTGTHICGDGKVETDWGESCDDGNTTNGDGCSSTCSYETAKITCGDGACIAPSETALNCPADCKNIPTTAPNVVPTIISGSSAADLTIQIGVMPNSFIQGSNFYSMVYVKNPGAQSVTDVVMTTEVPTGFILAAGADSSCKQTGTTVTCGPMTVEKNAIKTISLPYDAKSNLTCWTQNVQTYKFTSAADSNPSNNSVNSSVTVQCNEPSPVTYVAPTAVPPFKVGDQCEWNRPQMQDFSADGSTMVFSAQSDGNVAGDTEQDDQIYMYNTATKQTKKLTDETGTLGIPLTGTSPKISANGQVIIFNGKPKQVNAAGARMIQLNLATNTYKEISNAAGKPVGISADGRYSAFYNYGFCLYVYDNVTDTTTIVSRRTSEQTSTVCTPSAKNPTNAEALVNALNQGEAHMLPDGTLSFTMFTGTNPLVYSTGNLYAYSSATKQVKTVGPFEGYNILFSSDGKNMLFTSQTDNIGRRTFFSQPADLSTPKQKVDTKGAGGDNDGGFYLLSATGDLRLSSYKGGNPQTLKIFDSASGAATDLGNMDMSTLWTAFSANGTYFTFAHKGEGSYSYRGATLYKNALFVRPMNGGQTVAVPKPGTSCPSI